MELLSKRTKFRAYQIGIAGSLFSYYDGKIFTLIDANLTDQSEKSVVEELFSCGKNKIDQLHLTSWDNDHCSINGLNKILTSLKPKTIDIPCYNPDTESGKEAMKIIQNYALFANLGVNKNPVNINQINPTYIRSLNGATSFSYSNVIFHPLKIYDNHNNNSTIMLFRTGCYSVASLGDVESPEIAEYLLNSKIFTNEIDIMILAHHGADNGFTSENLIKKTNPSLAVCSADYSNKFDHPRQVIRDILYQQNVDLFTTKTGDVVIESIGKHTGKFKVKNLKANSSQLSSTREYISKRYRTSISPLLQDLLNY